ncbi:Acg family FMN-binding oxidoreductase [Cryptosporangium sp. NPDC048952]|uniref:Acg family FMN-binding oxidoreductase n=1 Tax=Cryptosporangium sp. NPDC048952 TaxID=3363961 RepID=UPI0037220651
MSTQVLDTERFAELVRLAIRAPSLHNTQPWLYRRAGDAVEVFADPTRALPVTDPSGWGVRIALGAATYNLRLGYALLGWTTETMTYPDTAIDDLVVRVGPVAQRPATPIERELAAAVPRRHTNRRPYLDNPVPVPLLTMLAEAAAAEACRLTVLDPRGVSDVSDLIQRADDELEHRPGYAQERHQWLRGPSGGPDGVRFDRLTGRPHPDERLRRRDFGAPVDSPDRQYESDPCLALLTSTADSRYDELRAGQALQHVLLRAAAATLTSSLYSQPIESKTTRTQLRALCGGDMPQMVLRIGYGVAHVPTPRRPVHEVILPGTSGTSDSAPRPIPR